jgi:16S rRNA (cytidine1402-2'-O)-methyltransferase
MRPGRGAAAVAPPLLWRGRCRPAGRLRHFLLFSVGRKPVSGTLYIVGTPIGNLEDITLRALHILREVDLIACEDTRRTGKLLAHYQISKPTISYREHNEYQLATDLVARLEAGIDIALVSDAGMPLISDPGARLVRAAIERSISVVPIPGPSAVVTAVAAAGLEIDDFTFVGFLPPKKTARRSRLAQLATLSSTLVLFEAPHRIKASIADALDVLGDRQCVVARELTKLHEEFLRGSLSDIHNRLQENEIRGELVVIISPAATDKAGTLRVDSVSDEVASLMEKEGLDQKTALKRVARLLGITRSEAYRRVVQERVARKD